MRDLKLTTLLTSLNNVIRDADEVDSVSIEKRTAAVSLIIGSVIGAWMPIPGTQAKSKELYYVTQVYQNVVNVMNKLIEAFTFDVDIALDACKNTWLQRYDFVYTRADDMDSLFKKILLCTEHYSTTADLERNKEIIDIIGGSRRTEMNIAISNLRNYLQTEGVIE